MTVSISAKTKWEDMADLFDAIKTDLTNLKNAIEDITAKLDADSGVTDTDYASTCNPPALNITD